MEEWDMKLKSIALKRGHNVKLIIDKDNIGDLNDDNLKGYRCSY